MVLAYVLFEARVGFLWVFVLVQYGLPRHPVCPDADDMQVCVCNRSPYIYRLYIYIYTKIHFKHIHALTAGRTIFRRYQHSDSRVHVFFLYLHTPSFGAEYTIFGRQQHADVANASYDRPCSRIGHCNRELERYYNVCVKNTHKRVI